MRKHRIPYFFANRLFDQVQAVSERVREFCIHEDDLAPERVVTVANGVDVAAIDAAAPSDRMLFLGLEQNTPLVMTVANLRHVKGIDVLLRAISIVRREFPEAVFALVGESLDAGYARELLALIAELGIAQNTRFLGPRTDVFSLLKMADVFCLPSRTEGLSNALLEAMACGLPCVATEVGGNSEVLADGQSGFLVPSEQPELLAQRLLALLRDQNLRRRMGNCGRQIVQERFTVQHMVDRLGMLYDDLLHRRGTSPVRWRGQHRVPEAAGTLQQ